ALTGGGLLGLVLRSLTRGRFLILLADCALAVGLVLARLLGRFLGRIRGLFLGRLTGRGFFSGLCRTLALQLFFVRSALPGGGPFMAFALCLALAHILVGRAALGLATWLALFTFATLGRAFHLAM